jgi:threonine synthase
VTDGEILEAYKLMASLEGVYCEPASAAGIAGLKKYLRAGGKIEEGAAVVAIITGHGLKDPDRAIAVMPRPVSVKAETRAILGHLKF